MSLSVVSTHGNRNKRFDHIISPVAFQSASGTPPAAPSAVGDCLPRRLLLQTAPGYGQPSGWCSDGGRSPGRSGVSSDYSALPAPAFPILCPEQMSLHPAAYWEGYSVRPAHCITFFTGP